MKLSAPSPQLSIFEAIVVDRANHFLEAVNEGRKDKEEFLPHYYYKDGEYYVFMAVNAQKIAIFNIFDENGNTPADFPANWRSLHHIKQDLQTPKKS